MMVSICDLTLGNINVMWLSAIKLAVNAGSHIYKKKQETKMRKLMLKQLTQRRCFLSDFIG